MREDLYQKGVGDLTTVVEYSVMIYYTQAFEDFYPDVLSAIDTIIADTNQGYNNSKIPLKVNLQCYEKAVGLTENLTSSGDTLTRFRTWKSINI